MSSAGAAAAELQQLAGLLHDAAVVDTNGGLPSDSDASALSLTDMLPQLPVAATALLAYDIVITWGAEVRVAFTFTLYRQCSYMIPLSVRTHLEVSLACLDSIPLLIYVSDQVARVATEILVHIHSLFWPDPPSRRQWR